MGKERTVARSDEILHPTLQVPVLYQVYHDSSGTDVLLLRRRCRLTPVRPSTKGEGRRGVVYGR